MEQLAFIKMHGLGNDFVILDARSQPITLSAAATRRIADRRLGVGCDQLIVIEPPQDAAADAFMRILNSDGSESGACGNATRCVGAILMQEAESDRAVIQTRAGLLIAEATGNELITVDMGPARLDWQEIPLSEARDTLHLGVQAGPLVDPVGVSMGNPHAVFLVDDVAAIPLDVVGPQVEHDPLFPQRTNVEAVQVIARDHLRLRVWERGVGITQACGSGACATLVAAVRRGVADRRARVELDGGDLTIEWRQDDGHVLMTGPVAVAFAGMIPGDLLASS